MGSPRSPDFGRLLARLARGLADSDIPFMVIGGQAVLVHGEPRLTLDVDLTLGVGPDRLGEVLEACAEIGLEPLPEAVEEFVRDTFVLPASDSESGVRVDLIFSTTTYEAEAIARARALEVGGEPVPFAAAEDLILHKLFAGRARDLDDAEGVVRRKGVELDWQYLERWAREFAVVPGREDLPGRLNLLKQSMEG